MGMQSLMGGGTQGVCFMIKGNLHISQCVGGSKKVTW